MAQTFNKITLVLDTIFAKDVLAEIKGLGVRVVMQESGRSILFKNSSGLRKLLSSKNATVEDSIQSFSFLVHPSQEREVVNYLAIALKMDAPGKGSIFSKEVQILKSRLPEPMGSLRVPPGENKIIGTNLMGISCITQKGEGNAVAEIGLSTGTAVPAITYGIGTGLRNRLGLWRIFIPAEKEISTLVLEAGDAETVMDMMINTGHIDEPGRGFIYMYPISMGVLNTKFFDGTTSHAASMEQVISAIDEIRGTTAWRKKVFAQEGGADKKRKFLANLLSFTMICNEGMGEALTKVAMSAGASGATISRGKHIDLTNDFGDVSPSREMSVMTIGEGQIEGITTALTEAGLFGPEASGELRTSPVLKACTFLGK